MNALGTASEEPLKILPFLNSTRVILPSASDLTAKFLKRGRYFIRDDDLAVPKCVRVNTFIGGHLTGEAVRVCLRFEEAKRSKAREKADARAQAALKKRLMWLVWSLLRLTGSSSANIGTSLVRTGARGPSGWRLRGAHLRSSPLIFSFLMMRSEGC